MVSFESAEVKRLQVSKRTLHALQPYNLNIVT